MGNGLWNLLFLTILFLFVILRVKLVYNLNKLRRKETQKKIIDL